MFRGSFGGKPLFSSAHEAANLVQLRKPIPPGFDRANSFTNQLGPEPARGWLLMLRRDLDCGVSTDGSVVNFNAVNDLVLEFEPQIGPLQSFTAYNLLVTQEPICLTPSHIANDPDAVYLVEVADRRCLVNGTRQGDDRYGSDLQRATWGKYNHTHTWLTVIKDLWEIVGPHLGQITTPILPITPTGTPINVNFSGESAWVSLSRVLAFLGLAIRFDPSVATEAYGIVQVGVADTSSNRATAAIAAMERDGRKIHDAEFVDVVRTRTPAVVRVYFPQHPERHARDPVYVDVATNQVGVEADLYVPLWDNLLVLHQFGAISNQAALNAQAAVRAADYFRMIQDGGRRSWKRFSGLPPQSPSLTLVPGPLIKQVTVAEQPGVGIYTDVFCNPYLLPEEIGFCRVPAVVRTGYAPVRLVAQRAELPAYTRSCNTITFTANGSQTVDGVATVIADRILLAACGGHVDGGVWEVQTKGTYVAAEVWVRALDADNSDDFRGGFTVISSEGDAYKNVTWRLVTDDPIALNTDAIDFVGEIRFHARLTSRTETLCGQSGSGSGSGATVSTEHTVYSYTFVVVIHTLDDDGCPAWEDTAITGTAYERNNHRVAVGTIVDIEQVFREDLSAADSGSGYEGIATGDACVYLFSAESFDDSTVVCATDSSFRFEKLECDGSHWVKNLYSVTLVTSADGCQRLANAILESSTVTASCCKGCDDDPPDSGSGSGSGSGDCEVTTCEPCENTYCLTLATSGRLDAGSQCEIINGMEVLLENTVCNDAWGYSEWQGKTSFRYQFCGNSDERFPADGFVVATLQRFCYCAGVYTWKLKAELWWRILDVERPSGNSPHVVTPIYGWFNFQGDFLPKYLNAGSAGIPTSSPTTPIITGGFWFDDSTGEQAGCYHCSSPLTSPATWALAIGACPGDGSGSGGGGGGPCFITTACCPVNLVPCYLKIQFSGATGDFACMEGAVLDLDANPGSTGPWSTYAVGGGGNYSWVTFYCAFGNVFRATLNSSGKGGFLPCDLTDCTLIDVLCDKICSPFLATGTFSGGGCAGSVSFTIVEDV